MVLALCTSMHSELRSGTHPFAGSFGAGLAELVFLRGVLLVMQVRHRELSEVKSILDHEAIELGTR